MMSIKKVIKRLVEAEVTKRYPMPPEIKDALENKLKMNPIPRFVNNLKAINSIPASYRIFLHNGQFFDIVYEEYSLMAKIGTPPKGGGGPKPPSIPTIPPPPPPTPGPEEPEA